MNRITQLEQELRDSRKRERLSEKSRQDERQKILDLIDERLEVLPKELICWEQSIDNETGRRIDFKKENRWKNPDYGIINRTEQATLRLLRQKILQMNSLQNEGSLKPLGITGDNNQQGLEQTGNELTASNKKTMNVVNPTDNQQENFKDEVSQVENSNESPQIAEQQTGKGVNSSGRKHRTSAEKVKK